MTLTPSFPANHRRSAAFALTIVLHLVLLRGWQLSTRIDRPNVPDYADRIQWLLAPLPEPAAAPPPARPKDAPDVAPPQAYGPSRLQAEKATAAPAAELQAQETPSPNPETTSILEQSKQALGRLGIEAPEANGPKLIRAKPGTAQMRLVRGMQQAHDMVPNKWYEAPKVTEIIDPGGYGRRRYRVVGARGTYCITVESNHAPDGIDSMQHGIKPKLTNCDPDEQAAAKQDW